MSFLSIKDAQFYYEIQGSGHPLILIAGYTCDHWFWTPIVEALSAHFQVLTFDNRGVGQTQDNNAELSVELMAEDVMALADKLSLQFPHIVGHSMGGTIAQTVARLYPDKIGKLGILSSASKWRQAMLRAFKSFLEMRERNVSFDFIFEASLPWIYSENFLQNDNNIVGLKNLILKNPFPQTLADQKRQFNVLETFNGEDYLKTIKTETLIVYGLQDITALPFEAKQLASKIPNSELVELDCAHGIVLEQSKQLPTVLLNFFRN